MTSSQQLAQSCVPLALPVLLLLNLSVSCVRRTRKPRVFLDSPCEFTKPEASAYGSNPAQRMDNVPLRLPTGHYWANVGLG